MSGQDTVQYRELLSKLQSEENRLTALNDINNFLIFKSPGEAISTITDVGISKIVHCLNVPDKVHVYVTCEVLKVCFEKFEAGDAIKHYLGHIMHLLRHEQDCVRRLAVHEVFKALSKDINLLPVPQYMDLFVAMAQLVADKDVEIVIKAVMITSNLPLEAYPTVLHEMQILLEYDSSSKCNAFEVIVNISHRSFEHFEIVSDWHYIDFMISQLHTYDDILYELNILELLSRLAIKPYAMNYLVLNNRLNKIANVIAVSRTNPLTSLLIPGFIKFLGCIAHHYPKVIFDNYPVFLEAMFVAFETGHYPLLSVAMESLGFIGKTVEGKLCLAALGYKYTQLVDKLAQFIRNSPTEIKVRALYCFAGLITIEQDPSVSATSPVDRRVTLMTREWFRSLSVNPPSMVKLLEICKIPFPDIKMAGFTLLDAVCLHQWGEELVARTAGFIEYLLDRSVDMSKESKEVKYITIKRLSNSVAFDANVLMRLRTYVAQGPFYSESMMEVALDGD